MALPFLFLTALSVYGQKDLREYIKDNLRDPMEIIREAASRNEIISIGEGHYNDNLRLYTAHDVIPALDSMGYRFLAVEVGSRYQEQMDDYLEHGRRPENDSLFTDVILSDKYVLGEDYLEVISSAKERGWNVYCVDVRRAYEPVNEKTDSLTAELLMRLRSERNPDDRGLVLYGRDHIREGPPGPDMDAPLGEFLERKTEGSHFSIGTVGNAFSSHIDDQFVYVPDSTAFLTDDPDISSREFYGFNPEKADLLKIDSETALIFDWRGAQPNAYHDMYGAQYDAIVYIDAFKGYPRNGHDRAYIKSVEIEYETTTTAADTIPHR